MSTKVKDAIWYSLRHDLSEHQKFRRDGSGFESEPERDRRMGARQLLLETLDHVNQDKLLHDCDTVKIEDEAIKLADQHSFGASSRGSDKLSEVAKTLATWVAAFDSPLH